MVENLENGPIFGGPGNSKDELSNALYDILRLRDRIEEIHGKLYDEAKSRRNEPPDADSDL